ncbi:MAG: hypothetical protein RIS25_291 [Actinomycetota bacterium]
MIPERWQLKPQRMAHVMPDKIASTRVGEVLNRQIVQSRLDIDFCSGQLKKFFMSRYRLTTGFLLLASLLCSGCTSAPVSVAPDYLVALINHSAPIDDVSGTQFCAGVLISPTEVLTAGHCVSAKSSVQIDAIVGANNLCNTAPIDGQRVLVSSIEFITDVDGAVINLAEGTSATAAVLGSLSEKPTNLLTAWGWGKDSIGGISSCVAVPKQLKSEPSDRCRAIPVDNMPEYFCATPARESNTCEGDSGGPVISSTGHVVGITISGLGCGADDPGIYLFVDSAQPDYSQPVLESLKPNIESSE